MRHNSYNMATNRLAEAFAGRKLLMISVFILVVVTGMFTTFLITPNYEATMSILVSRDRIDPQISAAEKNGEITQTTISDEEFNSELEMVKSLHVIKEVVTELDLVNDNKPKEDTWLSQTRGRIKSNIYDFMKRVTSRASEEPTGSIAGSDTFAIEKSVNRVESRLNVVPIKKSRIIKVSYLDTDPVRAKRTLEKIYEKYVELHVRINDKTEADQVFQEQTERFNQNLTATTNSLKQFDTQNGVTGTEIGTQRELILKQLYDAQAQASATQTEIAETEQKISALKEKIESMPEQIQTSSVSKYVGALDGMKEELVKLEQQRTEFLQKYKPGSRFVREIEERIQALKTGIAKETSNPPQEKSYALNDLRRRLEGDLNAATTSLSGLRKREKSLTAQASKLNGDIVALNTRSIERDDLSRKRTVNEEAYLLYQKKRRESEISHLLSKEQVMNFSVVDPPRTDGEQKNPKPLLNLIALIGVGGFAGLGSALLFNRARAGGDDRFVTALDLERRFGLPILATIPVIKEPRSARRRLS